jgi:hypothetical protein
VTPVPPIDWRRVLAQVVRTPRQHRQPKDAAWAARILNCGMPAVEELTAAYEGDGSFDAYDVWNIGLHSGSRRSQPEFEAIFLGRALSAGTDWAAPARYRIRAEAQCPRGADCASPRWSPPRIAHTVWTDSVRQAGGAWWLGTVDRSGSPAAVRSSHITEVWHTTLRNYRFHYTYRDLDQAAAVRRRRVGSCHGLSDLLAEELTGNGSEARVRHGFIWGGMTAQVHQWVEAADVDGVWKTLDISMAAQSDMFFGAEYKRFCFGSLPSRVIPMELSATPTARHDCGPHSLDVDVTLRRPRARSGGDAE